LKGPAPPSIEDDQIEAFVFEALRAVLGTGEIAASANFAIPEIDAALARAGKEFLDLMVACGFQRLGVPKESTGLDERTPKALIRALILDHDRAAIGNAFLARGIEHLFFKGALSDALWWGGRGMRGASDIDVLVLRSAENEATHALLNLGYERHWIPTHLATEDASKERLFHHHDSKSHFPVDLHIGLLNEPPYRDCADQVLQRAIVYETAVGPIRGPCLEDMLVFAGGNLGQSCFAERYKLVVDAACLMLHEKLDLHIVASRADQCHITVPLWGLMRLIETRLQIPVPDWFLDRLTPRLPIKGIVERVAGVHNIPWHPKSSSGIVFASWPLSGCLFWPLIAASRWAMLRIADWNRFGSI
jgi:hypothetical protein